MVNWEEIKDKVQDATPSFYWRIHHKIADFFRFFKYKYQILTRGYDDPSVWSVDVAIAKFALPRLKHLRTYTHSYPGLDVNEEQWNDILDKMIYSMQWATKCYFDEETSKFPTVEENVRIQEGFDLFGKYFMHLWD